MPVKRRLGSLGSLGHETEEPHLRSEYLEDKGGLAKSVFMEDNS